MRELAPLRPAVPGPVGGHDVQRHGGRVLALELLAHAAREAHADRARAGAGDPHLHAADDRPRPAELEPAGRARGHESRARTVHVSEQAACSVRPWERSEPGTVAGAVSASAGCTVSTVNSCLTGVGSGWPVGRSRTR